MCISQQVGEFPSAISRVKRVFTNTLKCRRRREKFCCRKLWYSDMRRSAHNVHILYAQYLLREKYMRNKCNLFLCVLAHTSMAPASNCIDGAPHTQSPWTSFDSLDGVRNRNSIASSQFNSVLNHAPVGSFEKIKQLIYNNDLENKWKRNIRLIYFFIFLSKSVVILSLPRVLHIFLRSYFLRVLIEKHSIEKAQLPEFKY